MYKRQTYDYNNANYTIIGNAVPKVYGGINTSVSYKGIALSLGFTYKKMCIRDRQFFFALIQSFLVFKGESLVDGTVRNVQV